MSPSRHVGAAALTRCALLRLRVLGCGIFGISKRTGNAAAEIAFHAIQQVREMGARR